ncbi:MAG: hypothetical protein Q8N18_19510 [Opitutaceae bacterium]|nr:hypothetical protein [Opitutaceae bacterium]
MKSKLTSFLAGFLVASCLVGLVAFIFQKQLRDRHADCPLDSNEAFLRSFAALPDEEQTKINTMFKKFTTRGPTRLLRAGLERQRV